MENKTLAIVGAGDLGIQLAHYAIVDKHYKSVVFFDDFTDSTIVHNWPVIGNTNNILNLFKQKKFDEIIIGIGYNHLDKRKMFYEEYHNKVPFGRIIHSASFIDPSVIIEEGSVIYPSCSLDINSKIGANTILNNGCTISHDSKVGMHCFLSPRVAIAGFVNIGNMCNLGINSTVIDNISISENSQLGASTVVIRDILISGRYVGNPARLIK